MSRTPEYHERETEFLKANPFVVCYRSRKHGDSCTSRFSTMEGAERERQWRERFRHPFNKGFNASKVWIERKETA